jgi:hypothetical protein
MADQKGPSHGSARSVSKLIMTLLGSPNHAIGFAGGHGLIYNRLFCITLR